MISKWKPITTTTPTTKTTTVGLNPAGFMAAQPQDQRKSSGLVTNIHGLIDGGSYTSEASPGAIPQCTWQAASRTQLSSLSMGEGGSAFLKEFMLAWLLSYQGKKLPKHIPSLSS